MRESKTIEFKEAISNTFLKTVSAFANYDGGTVLFGLADDGNPVGLPDPQASCLDIENRINDALSPQPRYALAVRDDSVVELRVEAGTATPCLYRGKAYRRNDTATVEVDRAELARLVLAGQNLTFEQLPASRQDLTFATLGGKLSEHLGLKSFDRDTLKTLELYSDEAGYNNAAAILADSNDFLGIDATQFGESINIIRRREVIQGISALSVLDGAMRIFDDLYLYEVIDGVQRKRVERVPRRAFREAVANALVHRTWDVAQPIQLALFEDRIEITSPGGLPAGIDEAEYLFDMVSVRRNPIVANVFYRLGIIEAFGTGILRIKGAYEASASKPSFTIREHSIRATLPVWADALDLSADEKLVYDLLGPVHVQAMRELVANVPFSRSKLSAILKRLVERGIVETVGAGRGLRYRRV